MRLDARTAVMGILNVTPDSFSDGGRYAAPEAALEAAAAMVSAGADLIDVGGESTRPGAPDIDAHEECRRVLPVVSGLRRQLKTRISVDTRKAEVARRALDAGADLINDVSALGDPEMLALLAARQVPVVLMHMRGTPGTMQADTAYGDIVSEVSAFLRARALRAAGAGLDDGKILLDPGLGFGKSVSGNLLLLRGLPELSALDRPLLVGASRKSFLGAVLDLPTAERLEGSLAVAAYACVQGAHMIRVHDVAATVRVTRTMDALRAVTPRSDLREVPRP